MGGKEFDVVDAGMVAGAGADAGVDASAGAVAGLWLCVASEASNAESPPAALPDTVPLAATTGDGATAVTALVLLLTVTGAGG